MIALLPAVTSVAYFASALAVHRQRRAADARQTAVRLCVLISAIGAALTAVPTELLVPANGMSMVPVFMNLSALVAVALAPLATHPPATLARMLLIAACSQLCLATTAPGLIAVACSVSAYIAWTELTCHPESRLASRVFAVFHTASSGFLISGAAALAAGHSATGGTLVLVGVGIRAAVLPGHSWFVPFCEVAPIGLVVVFLAPQLGVFAFLATAVGAVPLGVTALFAAAAAVTATAAAGLGLVQVAARRAVAFVVIGQTALVVLGAASGSTVARAGALITWQSLILAISGFAMAIAAAEARRGYLSLHDRGGRLAATPRLAMAVLLFGLACVGFPLTLGFVGEDLLIQGASFPGLATIPIVVTAANGITVLRWFLHLYSGTPVEVGVPDLRANEVGALTLAMALLLITGVTPRLIVSGIDPSLHPPSPHAGSQRPGTQFDTVLPEAARRSLNQTGSAP